MYHLVYGQHQGCSCISAQTYPMHERFSRRSRLLASGHAAWGHGRPRCCLAGCGRAHRPRIPSPGPARSRRGAEHRGHAGPSAAAGSDRRTGQQDCGRLAAREPAARAEAVAVCGFGVARDRQSPTVGAEDARGRGAGGCAGCLPRERVRRSESRSSWPRGASRFTVGMRWRAGGQGLSPLSPGKRRHDRRRRQGARHWSQPPSPT